MKYKIIYIDPPWQPNNKKTGGSMKSGADTVYDGTMSLERLRMMPISRIADDDCFLFCWWLGIMPEEALKCMKSWGFTLVNMNGFVWRKLTKNGKDSFGMGYYTRAGSESCLIAKRGKPRVESHGVRAVYSGYEEKHSKKPDEFADRIVQMCGDVPRIEIFARDVKPGWTAVGNEITGNDIMDDLFGIIGETDRDRLKRLPRRVK